MRSQAEALSDALGYAGETIDSLQDADAPEELIGQAERLRNDVRHLIESR